MPSNPIVVHTIAEFAAVRAKLGADIGFVPTMGALHQGHGQLVQAARQAHETVVVSIFVNPLQFSDLGECEDYEKYPRELDADVAFLASHGVDVVFAPSVEEMYPSFPPQLWVRTGRMGEILEGASRPGHFDGVATVVSQLFHIVRPHTAYFGQKDAQQVAIIQRLVADLHFPLTIATVPIVRAASGLAESSRNVRLSTSGKEQAIALSRAMDRIVADFPKVDLDAIKSDVASSPGVDLDYLVLVHAADLTEVSEQTLDPAQRYIALTAAWVEGIRLIDAVYLPTSDPS
ncbi:MAG: pantoate--beta-alanine ligase [Corynebacterium sp.]|nr:pantoate--beta-alanine ligase [Corynebacterium sp.]